MSNNFKKDYINYVLHSISSSYSHNIPEQARIKNILDRIIQSDDLVKITFIVGKTAGLEILFKYLLYISDKIDKSQISVTNLKGNFDYDVENLKKICEKIEQYKSPVVIEKLEIPEESADDRKTEAPEREPDTAGVSKESEKSQESTEEQILENERISDKETEIPEQTEEFAAENEGTTGQVHDLAEEKPELTLIENRDAEAASEEVFELTDLNASVETGKDIIESEEELQKDAIESGEVEQGSTPEEVHKEESEEQDAETESVVNGLEDFSLPEFADSSIPPQEIEKDNKEEFEHSEETPTSKGEISTEKPEEPELEIEINQPVDNEAIVTDEESVTSEAYNKFENKFFEEVKILEKLFLNVYNEVKAGKLTKVTDRLLQSFSEIIEISSELSNLTRQLSFDLTADIFLTINLCFTRAINSPGIITSDRIMLLNSSLSLVNSLIRGGNYLNYDVIVDKIEHLKKEMLRPEEAVKTEEKKTEEKKTERTRRVKKQSEISPPRQMEQLRTEKVEQKISVQEANKDERIRTTLQRTPDLDTVIFKMKWIIRDFEKVFLNLNKIKGEFSKFEALEKIDELNNYLRLIAKLAISVKAYDVCKLSEVSYVFLKYLKDYRMDLLDPEIQQITKYMIFTFKMLLTDRRPEDFSVLVQYLNNPVKIFTDT